jgi:hypothetical protein
MLRDMFESVVPSLVAHPGALGYVLFAASWLLALLLLIAFCAVVSSGVSVVLDVVMFAAFVLKLRRPVAAGAVDTMAWQEVDGGLLPARVEALLRRAEWLALGFEPLGCLMTVQGLKTGVLEIWTDARSRTTLVAVSCRQGRLQALRRNVRILTPIKINGREHVVLTTTSVIDGMRGGADVSALEYPNRSVERVLRLHRQQLTRAGGTPAAIFHQSFEYITLLAKQAEANVQERLQGGQLVPVGDARVCASWRYAGQLAFDHLGTVVRFRRVRARRRARRVLRAA